MARGSLVWMAGSAVAGLIWPPVQTECRVVHMVVAMLWYGFLGGLAVILIMCVANIILHGVWLIIRTAFRRTREAR
jgi:D-alanyl-lipoteichoic acid acyltransferase DltB (MBOAT superfamily)